MMSDRPRAEPSRRAVAEALVKESDPTKVVAYFCTNCGTVYSNKGGTGKEDAERCTVKSKMRLRHPQHCKTPDDEKDCTEWACEECGKPAFSPYQWFCGGCLSKRRTDQDSEKLAKAELVESYPDDQGVVWGGDYYQSIDDFVDHCEGSGWDVPDRVWATTPTSFMLSLDDALESAFENWAEGCEDAEYGDWSGEEELRAAVDAFNKANSGMILYFEGTKAVDMTPYQHDEDDEE